jgi:hypothetical protein
MTKLVNSLIALYFHSGFDNAQIIARECKCIREELPRALFAHPPLRFQTKVKA